MTDNGKLIAIAVLAITAVLLLCTVVILDRMPASSAYAGNSPDRGGDYLMIPGGTIAGDECIYVVDVGAQQLFAYTWDPGRKEIIPRAKLDMSK